MIAEKITTDTHPPLDSGAQMMAISDREFQQIRGLIYDRFGINLTQEKKTLLVGRLQKYLRDTGIGSFQAYHDHLLNDRSNAELDRLINSVSTNYSYFYREEGHFQYFQQTVLPTLANRMKHENARDLRIWSAGCSTGEEPYMLVMLMMEYFAAEYPTWNAGILATDISSRVLQEAQHGSYPADKITRIPSPLRHKYFRQLPNGFMAVQDAVRNEVTFRRFNLMNSQFPFKKPFHVIFCRNVMIYFDQPTREALLQRFHDALLPGGYLFIGHSETLGKDRDLFRFIMPACYCRR